MHLIFLIILLLIEGIFPGKSICQIAFKNSAFNKTDSLITEIVRKEHIPGLSVGVIKNNQIEFLKGYGYSNLEHGIIATDSSMFGIASITKIFTAIAIMKLEEDDRLSLNDNLSKYFVDIPEAWKTITLKHLLNHTSGISSFSEHNKIPCAVEKQVFEYERGDAWKEVACLPLKFNPGEKWSYGDTGYYLLGLIIQKISGKPYEDYVKEIIWTPLNMHQTRLISYTHLIPNRVDGYDYQKGQYFLAPRFQIDEFSNGGIVSNASEMLKLHQAFTSEKILKKSTWQKMWEPTVLNDGKLIMHYGFGFGITPFEGRKRVGHNGGGGLGYSTALTHFPEDSITVIFLSNINLPEGRSGQIANTIASFYFK